MPSRQRNRTPASAYRTAVTLHDLADACAAFPEAVLTGALPAIGMMMKTTTLEEAARAVGGDRRLSRMGRRGVKLDAGYDNVAETTVRLTPRPLGAWTLVESGSNRSQWWEPRQGKAVTRRGVRRQRRRLSLPARGRVNRWDNGVRWYVRHGPVSGKRAWSRAFVRIDDALPDTVHTAVLEAWTAVR